MTQFKIGDKIRRNPKYNGSDHGFRSEYGPEYYEEEGTVTSVDKLGVPMVKWASLKSGKSFGSFTYPNYKRSLIKHIPVKDMSLPDELFEL